MLRFTTDHEWVRLDGDVATIGISQYAREALGEIVYVEPPEAGRTLSKGDEAVVVESVKAASEIYSPLSGEVVEGNMRLIKEPGVLNKDPLGEGWLYKLRAADVAELDPLMDEAAYQRYIDGLD